MRKLILTGIALLAIFILTVPLNADWYGWGGSGSGDMTKATYDADLDNIVDSASSITGGSIGAAAVSESCDVVRGNAKAYIEDSLDYYLLITRHNDTIAVLRAEMTDSANDVWNDSATIMLRRNGSIPLSGNWTAGNYDITGLEKVSAESLVLSGPAGVDSLTTQHLVLVSTAFLWTTPRDTATKVWNDSAGVILREDGSNALTGDWVAGNYDITGLEKVSAESLWGEIDTTQVAFTTYVGAHGGGASGAEISDSCDVVRGEAADTADVLRAEMPDSADAAITALKGSASTITQTWEWDGGNIIAADGQKIIVTDDAEDDSLYAQISNDTAFISVTGIPLVLGEEGTAIADSFQLGGGGVLKKWVQVGSYMAFIENDDDTTYATSDTTAVGSGVMNGADIADSLDNADRTLGNQFTFTDTIDVQNAIQRKDTTLIAAPVQNLFIGKEAGLNIAAGASNTFLGWQAGKATTSGSYNTYLGRYCMPVDTAGTYNVVIGSEAGTSAKEIDYSVIIGSQAGLDVVTAGSNTFIGSNAGQNTVGQDNVYVGRDAGRANGDGQASYNTGIGKESCRMDSSGDYNTALGWQALYSNIAGHTNVAIGAQAGYSNTSNYSVFIGKQAGYSETGAEKLYIENSNADTTAALIFGDFATNFLLLNAKVKVDSLEVGPAGATITKIVKVGSHLAIILSGADTLWAAADTTNF